MVIGGEKGDQGDHNSADGLDRALAIKAAGVYWRQVWRRSRSGIDLRHNPSPPTDSRLVHQYPGEGGAPLRCVLQRGSATPHMVCQMAPKRTLSARHHPAPPARWPAVQHYQRAGLPFRTAGCGYQQALSLTSFPATDRAAGRGRGGAGCGRRRRRDRKRGEDEAENVVAIRTAPQPGRPARRL